MVHETYAIRQDTAHHVNNVTSVIKQTVQSSSHARRSSKNRRGSLDFVSDLFKQLFGAATNKYLDVSTQHVAVMPQQISNKWYRYGVIHSQSKQTPRKYNAPH